MTREKYLDLLEKFQTLYSELHALEKHLRVVEGEIINGFREDTSSPEGSFTRWLDTRAPIIDISSLGQRLTRADNNPTRQVLDFPSLL